MKKVLLINWDTYPNFAHGGVYTWVKSLIENMQDYEFIVLSELSNPNSNARYTLPPNVSKVIEVPIFGSNRLEEYLRGEDSLISKIHRTTESVIIEKFLPLYTQFISSISSDRCNPDELAECIIQLHQFLITYDSKKCLEYHQTWNIFIDVLSKEPLYRNMMLKEALSLFQVVQRNIQLFSIQIPKVDMIHCALAWLPSLIAIYAKKESNCPVMITEHGVAYRELVLYFNRVVFDEPSKLFLKVFSNNIMRTVYHIADVITPVCYANKDWEVSLGTDPSKIRVIYNGIDTTRFRPMDVKKEDNRPRVVCVTRIENYKDVICLIEAIKIAKEELPDIQCSIYGTSTSIDYSLKCIEKVKELELEHNVTFMGGTREPEKIYNLGDIVVVPSLAEGFPFVVIEAMACGKAVIASDVGGVPEQLKDCGILVRSRSPYEMAKGIVTLFKDEKLRIKYGEAALKKVKEKFSIEKSINEFRKEYEKLSGIFQEERSIAPIFRRTR